MNKGKKTTTNTILSSSPSCMKPSSKSGGKCSSTYFDSDTFKKLVHKSKYLNVRYPKDLPDLNDMNLKCN